MLQNTVEWMNWRKNKIGASDIPIILGVSPYSTPLQLWRRKIGFEQDQRSTLAMEFGKDNESYVREMLQQRYGLRIDPETCVHSELDWASCSLDGIDANGIIYEIKCCSELDHEHAKSGSVPRKYYPQLQWQMFVTEAKKVRYCSFNRGDLFVLEIDRDEDFIRDALIAATAFYQCMVDFYPPELTDRDYIKITDADFGAAAISYQRVKAVLEEAEKQEKFWKQKLIEFTDDSNCEGYGLRLTRIQKKGAVDLEKLCKDRGITLDDVEKYRKDQIGFWKISVVK